jgi:hypothetical protein
MTTSHNMKIVFGVIVVMTWMTIAGVAMAKTVTTPFGPSDDSCVHEIPSGASVDVQTGDVYLNSATVDHFASCTVSPTTTASVSVPPIQWYEWSNANAKNVGSLAQFDQLEVSWSVPSEPSNQGGSPLIYFFPSVQNQNPMNEGWSGEMLLLQPVLQWGNNGVFGGNFWTFSSWGVWGCNEQGVNCQYGNANPPLQVSVGDSLTGLLEQTNGFPDLASWYVQAYSSGLNEYVSFSFENIPASWPKFTYAQMGVLEAYGNTHGTVPNYTGTICCNNLPSSGNINFTLDGLWQAGPYWNSFTNVTGLSFTGYQNPFDYAPHCTFAPAVTTTQTNLTWNINADPACN